jgi:hypothetical protein
LRVLLSGIACCAEVAACRASLSSTLSLGAARENDDRRAQPLASERAFQLANGCRDTVSGSIACLLEHRSLACIK